MWLINSPIGRKVVMSVTGVCLILFLTFHCCMNVAAFFSADAYNEVCEFLGSNWYAVVGTLGLAFLAVCHIVYAFILTAQNRRARGSERYAVTDRRPEVSWASQNMLVLGIIILLVSCISFGFAPSGSISLMDSGVLCRHSAGAVRSGSSAGRLSVLFM